MSTQENPFDEIGEIALALGSNRVLFAHHYVALTSEDWSKTNSSSAMHFIASDTAPILQL
jgi:hypothetical protein